MSSASRAARLLAAAARLWTAILVLTALAVFPAISAAQRVKFPPPTPIDEPAEPSTPRLSPPPAQIPPPLAPGEPVRGPVEQPAPPRVESTLPAAGFSGVDPVLREIHVTFDRDMDTRGYSFSSDLHYPKVDGGAVWINSRTCALPVSLAPGRFYRVGINIDASRNFKGADGAPALPYIICFTTVGASPEEVAALKQPRIVTLSPPDGATGITPGRTEFRIVFDQRMRPQFSPVSPERNKFPKDIGIGTWSADMRQLTFPGRLDPQREFVVGLNSPDKLSFQNDHGVPLAPVKWQFNTLR